MPETRLERTRNPKPEVPPCIRLGHEWRVLWDLALNECIRCGLREESGVSARRFRLTAAEVASFKQMKTLEPSEDDLWAV